MKQSPQNTMESWLHPSIVLEGMASSPSIRLPKVMTLVNISRQIYIDMTRQSGRGPWTPSGRGGGFEDSVSDAGRLSETPIIIQGAKTFTVDRTTAQATSQSRQRDLREPFVSPNL